ncbi:MAG: Sir2 family NAD-dependent protein deacetylase, partial [Spirochaetaceae bacterium]|nr:Sir2 family NAD-dependent protein deacetylase [Spirochaetaceae bacterium]
MNHFETAAQWINKASNILIFTGAGVSTNCGIPDFRGPNGLYRHAQEHFGLPYAEALFDINYFKQNPRVFFEFSKELLGLQPEPSLTHRYLAELEALDKVELLVTQNVDMLHHQAGSNRVLECHGTYRHGRCLNCGKAFELKDFQPALEKGEIPRCGEIQGTLREQGTGSTALASGDMGPGCGGVVKPEIVFFGENLPREFYQLLEKPPQGDLLLVLGSSLSVFPAASFALEATSRMNSIIINLEPTDEDYHFD